MSTSVNCRASSVISDVVSLQADSAHTCPAERVHGDSARCLGSHRFAGSSYRVECLVYVDAEAYISKDRRWLLASVYRATEYVVTVNKKLSTTAIILFSAMNSAYVSHLQVLQVLLLTIAC